MKRTATEHPKVRRLARSLDIPHFAAVGLLECLWHFTARFAPAGNIGKWNDEEIASSLGWEGDATKLFAGLIECRLVDANPDFRLVIHDWDEHADDSVHMQLARANTLFANGAIPKLTRLSQKERNDIEKGVWCHPDGVHTESHEIRTAKPSLAKPLLTSTNVDVCPEIQTPDPPAVSGFVFPVVGKTKPTWTLPLAKLVEYREAYPDLDVEAELRAARQWTRDNPRNRKTAGKMLAFLTQWLNRSQNRGAHNRGSPSDAGIDDVIERAKRNRPEGA